MRRIVFALVAGLLLTLCSHAFADPDNGPVKAALHHTLPELKFDNVSVKEAFDYLRDVSGANLHVDWKTLQAAGVDANTNINIRVHSVSLRKALNMLLQEASPTVPLTWYLDSNVIEVTTREAADKQLITIVYPVDDLIMDIPDFQGPDFNLSAASSSGSSSTGTGSSSGSGSSASPLFSSGTGNTEKVATKEDRAEALVALIRDTVQPDVWKENGGPASIHYFNGHLIVTAPRSVHEAIGGPVD